MKIFFIGTVLFSKRILIKLLELNANIVGVATKSASNFNSDHVDLSPICISNQVPFKYVKDINSVLTIEWIQELNPDIIFVFGWSSLLKKELLNLPPMGVIGFHPTALPKNRGRHPVIWALVLGLEETASTFFFMDEGADTGDILNQKPITIEYEDTAATLYEKIIQTAILQIEEFVPALQKRTFYRSKQENKNANYWRKRGRVDGQIDFRMTSRAIYNLVRGLTTPYVGAHIVYDGRDIKIWKVTEVLYIAKHIEPGKILEINEKQLLVKTQDGAIRLDKHDFHELPNVNSYL